MANAWFVTLYGNIFPCLRLSKCSFVLLKYDYQRPWVVPHLSGLGPSAALRKRVAHRPAVHHGSWGGTLLATRDWCAPPELILSVSLLCEQSIAPSSAWLCCAFLGSSNTKMPGQHLKSSPGTANWWKVFFRPGFDNQCVALYWAGMIHVAEHRWIQGRVMAAFCCILVFRVFLFLSYLHPLKPSIRKKILPPTSWLSLSKSLNLCELSFLTYVIEIRILSSWTCL